jgi:hypothetical protein
MTLIAVTGWWMQRPDLRFEYHLVGVVENDTSAILTDSIPIDLQVTIHPVVTLAAQSAHGGWG